MRRRTKNHKIGNDYTCLRCGLRITPPVPHECNPDICSACDGKKTHYVGRDLEGKWIGYVDCTECKGTGKTIWD